MRAMGNFDYESGRRHLEEGDVVEALRSLLASLDEDPGNVEAYLALFEAYERAWEESGDTLVLDQMRHVALAGLRRAATQEHRQRLQACLDRADALLVAHRDAGE
jgi:hypothetical protein